MQCELQPGDMFLVASPGFISRMINAVQKFWASDNQAKYSHAGIILNDTGEVFEAVGKGITQGDLYHYAGKPVMIARHSYMDPSLFQAAFKMVQRRRGSPYPIHRLFLHLFPPLAKLGFGMVVCSELVAEFLCFANIMPYWAGVKPDDLAEMFRRWKGFEIVFEGTLPAKGENHDFNRF